jgi:hypothetical protein
MTPVILVDATEIEFSLFSVGYFMVMCQLQRLWYGIRNGHSVSSTPAQKIRGVCLKILKGYSFGQDSEIIIQINP